MTKTTPNTTSIAGIALAGETPTSGGAFDLDKPALADADVIFDGGWSIHLRTGVPYVVVRGCDTTGFPAVVPAARAAATRGLDILCAHDGPAYALANASDDCVAFWPVGGVLNVSWFGTFRWGFRTRASGIVTRADGTSVGPSRPAMIHHPSFTHFRRSQVETDLRDSFRHAYLALESILDAIYPQMPGTSESAWLQAALVEANKIAEPENTQAARESAVRNQFNEWYEKERNHLFHAKSSRISGDDLDGSSFEQLLQKKNQLLTYYIQLIRRHLGVWNGAGGVMTNIWFEHSTLSALEGGDFRVAALDDSDPAVPGTLSPMIRDLHGETPTGDGVFRCRRVALPDSRRVQRWEARPVREGLDGLAHFWNNLSGGALQIGPKDNLSIILRLVNGSGDFQQRFLT